MIHHVFNSDFSYLNHARNCFSKAGLNSEFYIITKKSSKNIPQNCQAFLLHSDVYNSFIKSINHSDVVLFHSLLTTNVTVAWDIIKNNTNSPDLAWVLYGSEITFLKNSPDSYHEPKTRLLYYRLKPARIVLPLLRIWKSFSNRSFKQLLNKMNFVAHFMDEELAILYREANNSTPALFHIYAILNDFIGEDFLDKIVEKDGNLMIGNSSSFTSNHIAVIDELRESVFAKNIIVPLNYGNKKYGEFISNYGKNKLGERFIPLRNYLPLKEYNTLLLSCSCVIMNHYRQQALGNIITMLYTGCRIYINDFTSTYQYFKRIGVHIFSLQKDMDYSNPQCFLSLSHEEIMENRKILAEQFGSGRVTEQLKSSFGRYS